MTTALEKLLKDADINYLRIKALNELLINGNTQFNGIHFVIEQTLSDSESIAAGKGE